MESTNQIVRREFKAGENKFDVWIYIDEENKYWFKAKDVALALGYKDCDQVIRLKVDGKNKICPTLSPKKFKLPINWHPKTILINESGIYELILASRKKSAKPFKRWICREVLPTLRKTGSYSMFQAPIQQQEQMDLMNKLLATKNEMIPLLEYKRKCELEKMTKTAPMSIHIPKLLNLNFFDETIQV